MNDKLRQAAEMALDALITAQETAEHRELERCFGEHVNQLRQVLTEPHQREWVGLTNDEIRDLWSWSRTRDAEYTADTQQHAFARAIEAKLKELNT